MYGEFIIARIWTLDLARCKNSSNLGLLNAGNNIPFGKTIN
jgi:hypothetical protein